MPQHVIPTEKRAFAKKLRHAQTAPEVMLWHELRDRRLGGWKFRRQVPVEGYVADFVCFDARLVVEVDGPLHAKPENRTKDAQRDAVLKKNGFQVLRLDVEIGAGRMVEAICRCLPPHPAPDQGQGLPSPAKGEGDARHGRSSQLPS